MIKRISALIISVIIALSSLAFISTALKESNNDDIGFIIKASNTNKPTVTGNSKDGYSSTFKSGTTVAIADKNFPISRTMFDLQMKCNDGASTQFFGVTKNKNLSNVLDKTDNDKIIFIYEYSTENKCINVYLNGDEKVKIGTIANIYNDNSSSTSIIQIGFSKVYTHWYLTVNGVVCDNGSSDDSSSHLEKYFGNAFFENAKDAYILFGSICNSTNEVYFKPLTNTTDEWNSISQNGYFFNDNGNVYDRRDKGITEQTIFSSNPQISGTKESGNVFDFTGTLGYVQTAVPFDLKTTSFNFSIFNNKTSDIENVIDCYLGFTTNPSQVTGYSPSEQFKSNINEINITSALSVNQSYIYPVTNNGQASSRGDMVADNYAIQRDNSNYTSATTTISFVKQNGPDGNQHWYIKMSVYGRVSIISSNNVELDKSLQFDKIIDKKVYIRLGTFGANSFNAKMYCKFETWPDIKNDYPDITIEESDIISGMLKEIDLITVIDENNYIDVNTQLQQIRNKYNALSENSKLYFDESVLSDKETRVRELYNIYNPGDWYLSGRTTYYTGDKYVNWEFEAANNTGDVACATTSENYDMVKNSFYIKKLQVPGGSWFLFGLTNDMKSSPLSNEQDGKSVSFILTPYNNSLVIQIWDPSKNKVAEITSDGISQKVYEEFEYYNRSKEHFFAVVKKDDQHWYLKIDDIIFDDKYFDFLDEYMNTNSKSSKVRFGGYGGISDCTVNIIDRSIDESICPEDIANVVNDFDNRVRNIGGVSVINSQNISSMENTINNLLEEYNGFNSRIQKYIKTKTLIDDLLTRIELIKESSSYGDWYTSNEDFTYQKSKENEYDFNSVLNKGSRYATTTKSFNATKMGLEWKGIAVSGGSWFEFGLSSNYKKQPLDGNTSENLTFILTPVNSDVLVQYWDGDARVAKNLQEYSGAVYKGFDLFNLDKSHTFGITKGNDGHWYIYIDKKLFNEVSFDTIDNFMEKYGDSAYFSFGSYQGTDSCNVKLVDSEFEDTTLIVDDTNIKGNLTKPQSYLQALEENYISIWEYNKETTEMLYNMWNQLEYREQLEVEGILIDDSYLYDINDLVTTYSPDLYYATQNELDNMLKSLKSSGNAPQTRDNFAYVIWSSILSLSCFGVIITFKNFKKI